jgi:hypothetical protein
MARTVDGVIHVDRFDDAASYRAHLAELHVSIANSLTIDDLAGWLEAHASRRSQPDEV